MKRLSSILVVAAVAALIVLRRRETAVEPADAVWTPVTPS
jgi:hypothetical protein